MLRNKRQELDERQLKIEQDSKRKNDYIKSGMKLVIQNWNLIRIHLYAQLVRENMRQKKLKKLKNNLKIILTIIKGRTKAINTEMTSN